MCKKRRIFRIQIFNDRYEVTKSSEKSTEMGGLI